MVDAETLTISNYETILSAFDGIVIPGGFGVRGIEGKILAARFCRCHKVPFLGICLGMQVAVIEFMRNVCGLEQANSLEFNPTTNHPAFKILPGRQIKQAGMGGSLRIGAFKNIIVPNTLASKLYQPNKYIFERHRHRYEFNNDYRPLLEEHGMVVSAVYEKLNLVEVVELQNHPFFIGSQFHPEFTSRPTNTNPLFIGLLSAIIKQQH